MDLYPGFVPKAMQKSKHKIWNACPEFWPMWFCMGIRPTVVYFLKLLHTLPRWFPQLSPLIMGHHAHPQKGGSVVVRAIASESIPEK